MTDDAAIQPTVASEYLALADVMAAAAEADWNASSLCEGWRVREVIAHMTMAARYDQATFMAELQARDLDFGRLSNEIAARDAQLPTAELVANLRADTLLHWAPRGSYHVALNHVVIHGLDVMVPLGDRRYPPAETLQIVLDDLTAGGVHEHFGTSIIGRRLETTDLDWSYGSGQVLRGNAGDLALALCGQRSRPAGSKVTPFDLPCDSCSIPGAPIARAMWREPTNIKTVMCSLLGEHFNAASQVDGMVAQAFVETSQQGDLGGHRGRHHTGGVVGELLVEDVEFLVGLVQLHVVGGPLGVGVGGGIPHTEGDLGHSLDDPSTRGCHVRAKVGESTLGNVFGQIGAALQPGQNQQYPYRRRRVSGSGESRRIVSQMDCSTCEVSPSMTRSPSTRDCPRFRSWSRGTMVAPSRAGAGGNSRRTGPST